MKMSNVFLATAVMLAAWSLANAELRKTPRGEPQALATADYGGVSYSTAAFGPVSGTGVHYTTACTPCTGVVYGAIFSSGPAGAIGANSGDFLEIFDSTSVDRALSEGPIVRLHNMYQVVGTTASGFATTGFPLRFNKGLIFRPGQSTNNLITVPFYQEP